MGEEHSTCKDHSGIITQVQMVCDELRHNTTAVNQLCVEIKGLAVKGEQTEKDINNLGRFKAEKTEINAIKKNVGLLQKILYSTLLAGIFVGIVFMVAQ